MKKLFLALVAIIILTPSTLANAGVQEAEKQLSYGVSPEGCYYANEKQTLAYSKDASLMFESNACQRNYHMSSVWYVKRNNMEMPDSYNNRVHLMNTILKGK